MTAARGSAPSVTAPVSLRRWPTWVGIGVAALVAIGLSDGVDLAAALPAAAIVYLGAAALAKPSAAWPLLLGVVLVIFATDAFWGDGDATWVFLGLGVPLLGYGLLSEARRASNSLILQAFGMVGFGAVAAIALRISEDAGAYLVAAGLLGHAAWDAYHHRANKTVVRPYAEFCLVVDALLAIAIVIATV
jgi:hypothetical protein